MPLTVGSSTAESTAAFYFDLRSPEAYLAAERVIQTLGFPAEWIPVRSSALGAPDSLEGFRCEADALAFREATEARAARAGLQPMRWPARFPADGELALLAATYAKGIGRVVAFALAAFRQAFAGGRDLDEPDSVVIAGSACEMHPTALLRGTELRATGAGLERATTRAVARGVRDVPAVWLPDGRVFHGEPGLDEAAAAGRS